jgi:endoglucanase
MKKILSVLFFCCSTFTTMAQRQPENWPKIEKLTLEEIRTASNNILVAFFLGPDLHEVSTQISEWRLNGKIARSIDKWITPTWRDSFGYEHHIYLKMDENFINGKEYTLTTPHGDTTFIFNSREIFSESIKTNQSGYSALAQNRFANFAIWTGTGGSKKIEGDLPEYEVFEMETGKTIVQGLLTELGANENSGDFVYRMDLSVVPEGGPYMIEVKGYGRSYPFGVGGVYSQRLSYISFRGLLHHRCGMEQKQPYFDYDIREICHVDVYDVQVATRPEFINIDISTDPVIMTYGGYHDAGDADRRDHHMIAPMVLLTYYDMFPDYFSDNQFNIPDIFDEDMHPAGQGNGIPDIIDEAEWGTFIWEILQEPSGGVKAGTEKVGYFEDWGWEVTLDTDPGPYGTFRVENHSTTLAAGLFAHLARVIKSYKPERAAVLQDRAERAWAFAGNSENVYIGHKLNYLVQYYLLTGDQATHNELIKLAPDIPDVYKENHQENPRSVHDTNVLLGAHFFSYLVQEDRPKDPSVVKHFEQAIKNVADFRISELENNPWPNGTSEPNRWWGSQTAQGQYADPILMQWRLTGEQKYIDAASQLMDYNQGLNPIGKCYLTGTGFDPVTDPLSHDSYARKLRGWGPNPGIQVFGPGNIAQLLEGTPEMIPALETLPAQRQWLDNRLNVSGNEYTIPESITFPSVIYTILAGGKAWDRKTIPFSSKKLD